MYPARKDMFFVKSARHAKTSVVVGLYFHSTNPHDLSVRGNYHLYEGEDHVAEYKSFDLANHDFCLATRT